MIGAFEARKYIKPLRPSDAVCVNNLTIIGSDNGLAPGGCQAIIWTNAGVLLTGLLGTNFSGILIEVHIFSSKKMHLKMLAGKWRPFCLGLNVLTVFMLNSLEYANLYFHSHLSEIKYHT